MQASAQDRNHVRYLAAIALAAAAAYAGTLSAPFVFDDPFAIAGNPALRHLWPPWLPLLPPHGQGLTVEGRPVLNLSFAADYAIGGLRVWSYHVTNVLIHIFAGWTLFGVVRRTLRRTSAEAVAEVGGDSASTFGAFATALLWTLHPLQTESVAYISQRAESLMGLFYLLTLYFFIRYTEADTGEFLTGRSGRSGRIPSKPFLQEGREDREERHWGESSIPDSATKATASTAVHPDLPVKKTTAPQLLPDLPNLPVKNPNIGTTACFPIFPTFLLKMHWFGKSDPSRSSCKNGLVFSVLSVVCCLLGMGTKEVMVTAPVVVLLYDRTFVSGSFAAAWRARRRYYLALAGTWVVLAGLAASTGSRGRTAGFGLGVTEGQYLLGQCQAVAHYLRLSVWPHPLIFDYGPQGTVRLAPALACGALLLALLASGIRALAKPGPGARGFGFAVVSFFLILAPTSIVPLIRQTVAEHRMYLPLAAVIAVSVCLLARIVDAGPASRGRVARAAVLAALALLCLGATVRRNRDYRSVLALYRDTAAKRPDNVLARYNLGLELETEGRNGEAAAEFEAALRLLPAFPQAEFNLGNILADEGRWRDAESHYEAAVRIEPNYARAHEALGDALLHLGRSRDARWQYNAAWLIDPGLGSARSKRDAIDRAQPPDQKGDPSAFVPQSDTCRPSSAASAALAYNARSASLAELA